MPLSLQGKIFFEIKITVFNYCFVIFVYLWNHIVNEPRLPYDNHADQRDEGNQACEHQAWNIEIQNIGTPIFL